MRNGKSVGIISDQYNTSNCSNFPYYCPRIVTYGHPTTEDVKENYFLLTKPLKKPTFRTWCLRYIFVSVFAFSSWFLQAGHFVQSNSCTRTWLTKAPPAQQRLAIKYLLSSFTTLFCQSSSSSSIIHIIICPEIKTNSSNKSRSSVHSTEESQSWLLELGQQRN
jgi:hypothetical protein